MVRVSGSEEGGERMMRGSAVAGTQPERHRCGGRVGLIDQGRVVIFQCDAAPVTQPERHRWV